MKPAIPVFAGHARSVIRCLSSTHYFERTHALREQASLLQKYEFHPKRLLWLTYKHAESESDTIRVVGVVIVGVAVAVDITEVIIVAGIRRTLPPVVS